MDSNRRLLRGDFADFFTDSVFFVVLRGRAKGLQLDQGSAINRFDAPLTLMRHGHSICRSTDRQVRTAGRYVSRRPNHGLGADIPESCGCLVALLSVIWRF